MTVATGPVDLTTDLSGRLQAVRTAQVRARVEGVVDRILFKEGADIKAGTPLFQIDPRAYRAAAEAGGSGWPAAAADETEAARHDLMVYSPGFAQPHPWMLAARRAGLLCLGELDFGALLWSGAAIAITGTNGKTTLTEFLSFAHKRAGLNAIACGNVGLPLTSLANTSSNAAWRSRCPARSRRRRRSRTAGRGRRSSASSSSARSPTHSPRSSRSARRSTPPSLRRSGRGAESV